MKHIALQDAKAAFGKVVAESRDTPVIITLNGKEAAVVLPARSRKDARVIQGRRGAIELYKALRAAPGEL
jgi:prevent-host-death family protein